MNAEQSSTGSASRSAPGGLLKVLKPEEVTQAKAEARKQFERIIACAAVKPHPQELDRWYGPATPTEEK